MLRRLPSSISLVLAAVLLPALPVGAACLSDLESAALVANYLAKKPAANPEGLSDADGACTRAKFNSPKATEPDAHAQLTT